MSSLYIYIYILITLVYNRKYHVMPKCTLSRSTGHHACHSSRPVVLSIHMHLIITRECKDLSPYTNCENFLTNQAW